MYFYDIILSAYYRKKQFEIEYSILNWICRQERNEELMQNILGIIVSFIYIAIIIVSAKLLKKKG